MSCSEWKTVKLKDITTDGKGYYGIGASAVEYDEKLLTYLRITDISDDGRIIKEGLKSVSDKDAENYILKKNDIVFARTGNSTGRAYFYEEKDGILVFAGFLIKFNLDENKVNPKFIRYYTLTDEYKNWIQSFSTGSTRKNINAKMYGEMEIKLPPRKVQDKIVDLMDSLDKKIELNNEMNKTLEEMAQSIFKRWFVDFEFPNEDGEPYKSSGGEMVESELGMIPKGWEVTNIDNICMKVTSGGTPSRKNKDYYNGDIIWIKTKELNDTFVFDSEEKISSIGLEKSSAKLFPPKTVMIAMYGATVGKLGISSTMITFNQATCGMVVNTEVCCYEYLYLHLINQREKLKNLAIGSAQQNLSVSVIKEYNIIKPIKQIMEKFKNIIKPIYDKIECNQNNTQNLKSLRYELLPKLMRNEIK